MRLRVTVLGRVRAWIDGVEVDLGPARQRALFAVLASRPGRLVGRDDLIEAVWGASPPATAGGNVYTYVSGLRRRLEPELLTSGPNGYALQLAPEGLDAEVFQRLRGDADGLLAGGDPAAAAARLEDALKLWHGDAYAGLTAPYLERDRARLADLRLATAEQRARLLLDRGDDDSLVADLAGLVRDHPLHEPLHELLMRALHRAGRFADALEVYRRARRTLVDELSVEPGPGLRELQKRVLADSAATDRVPEPAPAVLPTAVANAVRAGQDDRSFGRDAELDYLRGTVRALAGGAGGAVWIDGEPGIGKTALLTAAFADAAEQGCQLAWGAADELGQRVPLQVLTRALGLEPTSADPRMAAAAARLHAPDTGDNPGTAVERTLAYVRRACTTAPLVLVIDDMQWADDTTVLVWERLLSVTTRIPLLLVAAARPEPHTRELVQLRRRVQALQRLPLGLRPLHETDIERLVSGLVGASVGPNLRLAAARAAGNPLYAREITGTLLRQDAVRVTGGVADIDAAVPVAPPETLLAAVRATVDFLSEETQAVLRLAALLGTEFSVADVAAVTGRSTFELVSALEEALTANVLVDIGDALAFRHPFLRQALHDSVPAASRPNMHRRAAEALAAAGSPVTRVAEQLAADGTLKVDEWVLGWLADHHAEVVKRAPRIAGDLFRQALFSGTASPAQHETLLVALVKLDFRHDAYPVTEARAAMEVATDPADRAEMRQLLAAMRFRQGHADEAIGLLRDGLRRDGVPEIWRTRHRVLLANFRRGDLDDLDRAERNALALFDEAMAADQRYEAAFALQTIWLTSSIRRDHERALDHVDRALDIMRDEAEMVGMYFDLLDNRMFSLQNLDRLDETQRTLHEASLFAIRHRLPSGLQVANAVQCYWLGRWDEALGEAGTITDDGPGITFFGMREPGTVAMLLYGVAALIALRQGNPGLAATYLDSADTVPATDAERESCDFLLVARALAAEQQGRPDEALQHLAPLLVPEYAPMMLRHQWLPDAVRLALETGRRELAEQAAGICALEADKEVRPARGYAAHLRCQAMLHQRPAQALAAAERYGSVGRAPERAAALEDAAVLLSDAGSPDEAAKYGQEAIAAYDAIGAVWDSERARRRLYSLVDTDLGDYA